MSKNHYAKKAAGHLSNLRVWGVVIDILEGSHLSGESTQVSSLKIVKMAKSEQQKELRKYDSALKKTADKDN